MATLWNDHKPTLFLTSCGASAFKIIQTNKELKWCQHSVSTLKKKQHKPKAKNTPNKKSGNTGQSSNKKSSTKLAKDDNQLKNPNSQKKAKNSSKSKGRNKGNNEVLAEILNLLRSLDSYTVLDTYFF
ncbi:unnamed protein product [Rhizophagus irregularis]|nr:unnamed protein product [Rhizophagus irregularis]